MVPAAESPPVLRRHPPATRGRDRELERIGDQLAQLQLGRASVTVVEGGPGAGKTRLIEEAARMAGRLGARPGLHTFSPGDHAIPLGGLMGALLGGADPILEPSGRGRVLLRDDQRHRMWHELTGVLQQRAAVSPLMVALDDVQWADPETATAVEALSARLMGVPIAWLLALRQGQTTPHLAAVLRRLAAVHGPPITLTALDDHSVARMVADLVGGEPEPSLLELAGEVHGTPFWIAELVAGLREEGRVHFDKGVARLLDRRLPERVRSSMAERLARMSPTARRVASAGSVLGRRITFDELAHMLQSTPLDLVAPVSELIASDLLVEDGEALRFRHDILREAVSHTLPGPARGALERQAARVLLQTGAPAVEVALRIASGARPGDEEAIEILVTASRTLGASDPGGAAGLLERALDLMRARDERRGGLLAELVRLLHAAGRIEAATASAETALRDLLRPEQESEVRYAVARMLSVSADVRADHGERALALPGLDARDRARHSVRLVHNRLAGGRRTSARSLLPEARAAVATGGDEGTVSSLALAAAGLSYQDGDFSGALVQIEAVLRGARLAADDEDGQIAQLWRAEVLQVLDRFDEGVAVADAALLAARQASQAWAIRMWEQWRGRHQQQLGEYADAIVSLEAMFRPDEAGQTSGPYDAPALSALAAATHHVGNRQLKQRIAAVAERMVEGGPPEVRRHGAWVLARQALAEGDVAAAHRLIVELGLPSNEPVLPFMPLDAADEPHLVRLAIAAGDVELAEQVVEIADLRAQTNGGSSLIVGTAAHVRGLARGGDRDALEEAVEIFRRSPRRPSLALAAEDAGVAAAWAGASHDAIAHLDRALELAVACGATVDASRVRRRLRALGVERRTHEPARSVTGWASLTDSELAVARAIAQGRTNREAADELFLSPHTVNSHLRKVFVKLGINSRVKLARLWVLNA